MKHFATDVNKNLDAKSKKMIPALGIYSLSSPGIEPGSPQPQCGILITKRTRPIILINIQIYKHNYLILIYPTNPLIVHPPICTTVGETNHT